jgi:hypothetical protein
MKKEAAVYMLSGGAVNASVMAAGRMRSHRYHKWHKLIVMEKICLD